MKNFHPKIEQFSRYEKIMEGLGNLLSKTRSFRYLNSMKKKNALLLDILTAFYNDGCDIIVLLITLALMQLIIKVMHVVEMCSSFACTGFMEAHGGKQFTLKV